MKIVFSLFFIVGGVAVSFAQTGIDGNWKGSRETPNGVIEITYTFKAEGNVLKGTWKTQLGERELEEGKVDGKKFSFSVSINDRKMESSGELVNENEIVLKSTRGEMKLTRVKP